MGEGTRGRWLLLQVSRPCQRGQEVCQVFSWGTCSVHRHATARGRRGRVCKRRSGVITSVGEDVGNQSHLHTATDWAGAALTELQNCWLHSVSCWNDSIEAERQTRLAHPHSSGQNLIVSPRAGPLERAVAAAGLSKQHGQAWDPWDPWAGCECKLPLTVKTGTCDLTSLSYHSRASVKWDDSSTDCK